MQRLMVMIGLIVITGFSASCSQTEIMPYSDSVADDGSYPNLNLASGAAAPAIGQAEAQATIRSVESSEPGQLSLPTSEAEAMRLRRLGQTHGQDAIRQIEASSANAN
ncbi:hypothetical protein [Notoacmeibacter ruber]|uniref:Uncharacterized protein n=1 Tax=Notoacmeibacter ruber TaxID=2670375 RepID=A0A3L7JCF3_9HYPH|nr:hypothetical protein [Notoacmeibacter ruber]RLQ87995.1 hypothetical protein D8780_07005 [Notoacmeibacter ruber]